MNRFPEELNEPSKDKILIDKTRMLIALRESHTLEDVQARLLGTELVLESDMRRNNETGRERPTELINHADKRYWTRSREGNPISEGTLNRLSEIFSEQLDWIGPVYQNPDQSGREGLFCPIPNVLVIKFATSLSSKDSELLEKLARYNMEEVIEKSKYLNEYHYFIIKNIGNENAYQIKDILLNESQFVNEVIYESMPMIFPASLQPNDTHFGDQWNMTRIGAGGKGTSAWDTSTGINSVVICILDTGCDLTHPDLQFSTPGVHLDDMKPDGSPIEHPSVPGVSAHGTSCAGTFNS